MNYKAYFAIEKKLESAGYPSDRKELIHNFTNGRKDSLSALSIAEYSEFLRQLNVKLTEVGITQQKEDWRNKPDNKMRRKIISLFKSMHYPSPVEAAKEFAETKGYLKKGLNDYTLEELPKLVWQAEQAYNDFVTSLNKKENE